MRVDPSSVPPGMLVDRYVPGANYVNVHRLVLQADPDSLWVAAHGVPDALDLPAAVTLLLRIAAVARGEGLMGSAAFEVEAEREGEELVLSGSHRYATYVTNLFLEPLGGSRTLVTNVTRARFSRTPAARLYLAAVRVFHDVLVEMALRRLERIAGARQGAVAR